MIIIVIRASKEKERKVLPKLSCMPFGLPLKNRIPHPQPSFSKFFFVTGLYFHYAKQANNIKKN